MSPVHATYAALSWSLLTFSVSLSVAWVIAPKNKPAPLRFWASTIALAFVLSTLLGLMVLFLGADYFWKVR